MLHGHLEATNTLCFSHMAHAGEVLHTFVAGEAANNELNLLQRVSHEVSILGPFYFFLIFLLNN